LLGVLRASASARVDDSAAKQVPAFQIDVPLTPATAAATKHTAAAPAGLLATLPLAFIGGLILNLMPCVFPVLGLKIMGFVNQAGADRKKITLHGLTFTAGVLSSFWTLAAALAVLRAGGGELGWGFQLQSPPFVFGLAAVMLVFALSMSGVCEFGGSVMGAGAGLQMQSGYRGSFFTGVLATVVATPCSAPFLAPALGVALVMPMVQAFMVFTTIAIGLSTPYLLLSVFPQAVRLLPRPGAWMETFKQAMAFPLYATAGYLIWVLSAQTSESGSLMVIFGLTLIAMATWLYGRYATPGAKPLARRIGVFGGLLLLGAGVFLGWPRAKSAGDLEWETWSPARVAELQAAGKPVYVDFTARWCATCQANKKVVFGSAEVRRRFKELGVVILRGDWTNRDALITAELARWNRSAVPFNLVYRAGVTEPLPLPELLTPGMVLNAFEGQ
jgi:thiol:disulfide interchange protein DsbD